MGESLNNKTTNSIMWSAIDRFSTQGIQFVLTIIIARLVSPSDYGLIAMLGIFISIAQTFIDSGFSNALIQKQDRTDVDFSTVFYFNIVVGVVVYLLLYLCSPYIASFYNEPKLDLVTKVVGLNLIVSAFSVVQRAKLTIVLNFKLQAIVSLIAVVISGIVGIYMASVGYGVWAIATQALLNNLLNTILLWVVAKWRPGFCFSIVSFKELFGFGSKLLAGGLLHTVYSNLYSLCIGKFFSVTELGLYNRAYTIAQYPSANFTNIITRATYPIECEIQDDDEKLQAFFYKLIRATAFIVFPLMIGLCVLAHPLIELLLTDKWLGAVPFLQIMCLAYMFDPIMRLNWDLLNVKHRSDYSLKSEIIKKIVAISILIITIPMGIMMMCIGLIVYSFADLLIITHFTKKILPKVSFTKEILSLLPALLLSLSMGVVVFFTTCSFDNVFKQVILGSFMGFLYYIFICYLFKRDKLTIIHHFIKTKL